jgi:cobaltochelatase CobN
MQLVPELAAQAAQASQAAPDMRSSSSWHAARAALPAATMGAAPNVGSNAEVAGVPPANAQQGTQPADAATTQQMQPAAQSPAQDAQASRRAAERAGRPPPAPKPEPQESTVKGFEMEALSNLTPAQKTIGTLLLLALGFALFGAGYVWRRNSARKLKELI